MAWDQLSGDIMPIISAIVAAFLTWITTRRRQQADTKKIEVDVWEKTLDVMQQKIVVPLTNRIDNLQAENEKVINRLNYLQNAINKMYYCRTLNNCPIRYELRKQKTDRGESLSNRGNPAHRQRAPDNDDHNPPHHYTPGDGEIELEPP